MPKQLYANNAKGRLNAGITNVATSLTLGAGQGALFPNPTAGEHFMATLIKSTGAIEVVKVTARSTDTFSTIVRAQEGTSAIAFDANDRVELRLTKGSMEKWRQQGPVEGITGNTTLTAQDVDTVQVVTDGPAIITLPAASALADYDEFVIKNLTEKKVTIICQGTDTHDGQAAATPYQLPSYSSVRVVKQGAGAFIYLNKPEHNVGDWKWAGYGTAPLGWVKAGSGNKSRTTYGGLFDVYGTTWGVGDGSTTFGIPDARGKTPIQAGTGTSSDSGGDSEVDITANTLQVPSNTRKWITGMLVNFTLSSGTITGLTSGNNYYVYRQSATLIRLAPTRADAQAGTNLIDFTAKSSPVWAITHTYEARTLGEYLGEEAHAQAAGEESPHNHTQNAHSHSGASVIGDGASNTNLNTSGNSIGPSGGYTTANATATNNPTAGGNAANIMQPGIVGELYIKT